jgi:serine/threonine protein kinase
MTPERWQQIEKLFHAALELKAHNRAAFLEEACGGDESLRREVEGLLAHKEKPEGFMTRPAADNAIQFSAASQDTTYPPPEVDQRNSEQTVTVQLGEGFLGEFGHYRIVRLLGKGGMGEVYEAEDLESERRVALKVLSHSATLPVDKARFLREGRLAASISHPHCVYVYGTEEIQGTPVITMEFVPGGTLKDRVKAGGPLGVAAAVDVILQVISGLEAAAAAGILHRDIKPSNCFIESDGQVKVGDFGLSISTLARDETHLTAGGTILGTPAFASPEQLRCDELDVRSDIYSVGATLYYLLCGRAPFEESNVVKLLTTIVEQKPPSPRELRPQVPKGLAAIVMRCLAKNRDGRFDAYASLTRELQAFGSTATTPATLGLRFLAGAIDFLTLGVVASPFNILLVSRTPDSFLGIAVLALMFQVLYFSLLEGFWGASLGKAVCGLRVVGPERQAPGVLRALRRASVFFFVFSSPSLIFSLLVPGFRVLELAQQEGPTWIFIVASVLIPCGLVALLFSKARGSNGFAGLHELASKTRTVLRSAHEAWPLTQAAREIVVSQPAAGRVGPYQVLGSLTASPEHELLAGYDEKLRRKVWIRLLPVGSPAVKTRRRDLSRAGRLRWLSGKRTDEGSWDAYEAIDGKPLLAFLGEAQPWRIVRHWLHDLAEELHASLKDESATDLGLDRVWITAGGRAKLLEWQAPGLDPSLEESRLTDHEPCNFESGQRFLYRVALCALHGCMNEPRKAQPNLADHPLPLPATSFLKKLGAQGFRTSQSMTDLLSSLVRTAAVVPRWKRCVQLALCISLPLFAVILMGVAFLMLLRFSSDYLDLFSLLICLDRLRGMQRVGMAEKLQRDEKALEIYVAAHFRNVLSDPSRRSHPVAEAIMHSELHALAERVMAAHPNPTEEEIRESTAILEPFLRNRQKEPIPLKELFVPALAALFPGLVLGLLSGLLFRGGLVLRWFGIAVVTTSGAEVSRLRALWRSVIAWSPAAAASVIAMLRLFSLSSDFLPLVIVPLALGFIGIVWAAVNPGRGLQDKLAGTYLVPR